MYFVIWIISCRFLLGSERKNSKMSGSEFNFVLYSIILLSLFVIDYTLGNGLVDTVQKWFCNIVCFVRNAVKEEDKYFAQVPGAEDKINLIVVLGEVIVLSMTMIVSFNIILLLALFFKVYMYVALWNINVEGLTLLELKILKILCDFSNKFFIPLTTFSSWKNINKGVVKIALINSYKKARRHYGKPTNFLKNGVWDGLVLFNHLNNEKLPNSY